MANLVFLNGYTGPLSENDAVDKSLTAEIDRCHCSCPVTFTLVIRSMIPKKFLRAAIHGCRAMVLAERVALLILFSCLNLTALASDAGLPMKDVDTDAMGLFDGQQHPRLLISKQAASRLADRNAKNHNADWMTRILKALGERVGDESADEQVESSVLYDMRPRDLATLYLFTGEKEHAARAKRLVETFLEDEQFWRNSHSKGLTRAAGAVTIALAYDLCHDAWPADFNRRVSSELARVSRDLSESMGEGANTKLANNWQAVRYSTVILAALASDEPGLSELAEDAYEKLKRHLQANLGKSIWNPEGIGYTTYPWTFTGPAGIAARRAGLGDLRVDVPQTRLTLWTLFASTVAIPTTDDQRGLHPDLSDDNPRLGSRGSAALAFFYLPPSMHGALQWVHNDLFREQIADLNWGGGLYALLLQPSDIQPVNPAELAKDSPLSMLNFVDHAQGVGVFRNQWRDENDIVALVNATARRPKGGHSGPDVNTFRILGLGGLFVTGGGRTSDPAGQTNLFPHEIPQRGNAELGELEHYQPGSDGGGTSVTTGSCLGVEQHRRTFVADYSAKAGFPALFINTETSRNGALWRLNTPECNTVDHHEQSFTITAPNGAVLRGYVLEPAEPTFKVGTIERGGASIGVPYRGSIYPRNRFVEFSVSGDVCVVFTLSENDDAPVPAVEQTLHTATLSLGDVTILHDRNIARTHVNPSPDVTALSQRKTPLRPRGLRASTCGADAVQLEWDALKSPANRLRLERQIAKADDDVTNEWSVVAEFAADRTRHQDVLLEPNTPYRYRLIAVNSAGDSQVSTAIEVDTWPEGYARYVEDFAPAESDSANRLGRWTLTESNPPSFKNQPEQGSGRFADQSSGYLAVGHVPIGQTRAIYTADVAGDFSGDDTVVSFDVKAQETTVFSPMFRLSDGEWIMCGRAYVKSRYDWKTLEFHIAKQTKWWKVDLEKMKRGAEIELDPNDPRLGRIEGVGVFIEWVINKKTAAIDQFTLRAQGVQQLEGKAAR